MRWIGELIGGLWLIAQSIMRGIWRMIVLTWHICRASWVNVGQGLRPHSLASAAYLFMYVMLVIIGLILVLLGFNLADVDRWLDRHTYWWEQIGTIALKMFWAAMLAGCLLIAGLGIYERLRRLVRLSRPGTPVVARGRAGAAAKGGIVGWGFLVTAIVVGYFSVIGLIF